MQFETRSLSRRAHFCFLPIFVFPMLPFIHTHIHTIHHFCFFSHLFFSHLVHSLPLFSLPKFCNRIRLKRITDILFTLNVEKPKKQERGQIHIATAAYAAVIVVAKTSFCHPLLLNIFDQLVYDNQSVSDFFVRIPLVQKRPNFNG